MQRFTYILALAAIICAGEALAITIEQENAAFTPGTDWEYNSVDGTITIKTASDTETYVFWSHADGDPNTLASIEDIQRDQTLTSGTIRIKISRTEAGLTPGATAVNAISIDAAGNDDITSVIEGISISGDFLADAAAVIDLVGDEVLVGGHLKNDLTVNGSLTSPIIIEKDLEAGHTLTVNGDLQAEVAVNNSIDLGQGLLGNIEVTGDLADLLRVRGLVSGWIHVGGDIVTTETGSGRIRVSGDVAKRYRPQMRDMPGRSASRGEKPYFS